MFQISRSLLLLAFICLLPANLLANDPPVWRPVSPAELAMDKPQVEPDADAEAIFWEVRLDDQKRKKLSYQHYVRVKIFTERGREKFSKFDIPFYKGKEVEDVAARVIKPDGTIIELQRSDIYEREIIKQRKVKLKAKSFAVPGIAPGVIVEYQYRETFKGDSADQERLYFQREIPMQKVAYYVRPFKGMSLQFKARNMSLQNVTQTDDGFYVATMNNVPAFKEEPRMPPDEEIRRWVYLSYNNFSSVSWSLSPIGFGAGFAKVTEPDKNIKQKAEELTHNTTTDLEKLKILYQFSQNQIKNLSYERSPAGDKKLKIKKASDVLKKGMGYTQHIDILFAALARAIDLESKMVFSGNRSVNFFNPKRDPVTSSFVHPACIAVKIDGQWRYFNPGVPYLPFGKLLWYEEAVHSLLVGGGRSIWSQTPLATYDVSKEIRKGKFKLSEEGVLEGEVVVEYTGNQAVDRRREGFFDTADKRIGDFIEELQEMVSTGEFTNVRVDNFDAPDKPLTYSYKLRIPNYTQQTGKRMFFQPNVFEYNGKPEFSSSTRIHPIYFRYPWSEADEVMIELPENFVIENFALPDNVTEKSDLGELKFAADFNKETNTLTLKRDFYFGGGNRIIFSAKAYQPLKQLFDLFHKSDSYSLSLLRK